MKKVFICEDSISGIYSGIYDAWKLALQDEMVAIAIQGMVEQELFSNYVEVVVNEKKTIAVENLIKKHLGSEVYWRYLSCAPIT